MPPKTPDEPLKIFLTDYADIVGEPLYIQQEYNRIRYYNGTRVFQVKVLYQHIPRNIHAMFGRTVMCI